MFGFFEVTWRHLFLMMVIAFVLGVVTGMEIGKPASWA